MAKIVVFDLDKTLLEKNSSFLFGKYLFEKMFFSYFTMILLAISYFLHARGCLSLKKLHVISCRLLFWKQHHTQILQLLDDFFLHRDIGIRSEMVRRIEEAKKDGALVGILSASPDFLVMPIAKKLGVSFFLGTSYLLDNEGRYVSVSHVVDGESKLVYLRQLLEECNVTAQDITFYTDSIEDLVVLQFCGNPIVVSPDRKLRQIADAAGWKVLIPSTPSF